MAKPKLALIPATQGSKLYSVLPADGVGDFDFSRGSAATRINKDGLIETVASGVSRLNYPLIDGVVNGCPSHLLEPERLQKIQYSEDFSNAAWSKGNSTVTANQAISPDGSQTADLLQLTSAGGNVYDGVGGSGDYAFSVFAKYVDAQFIRLRSTGSYAYFDIQNGSVGSTINVSSTKIEDYGNGWYRCTVVGNNTNSLAQIFVSDTDGSNTGTGSVYLWGAQLEQGSYATSYIPNYGTSAGITRSAETANGAGDASTFNDSEGVLMAEISGLANDLSNRILSLSNGAYNNSTRIGYNTTSNSIEYRVVSSSSIQAQLIYALPDIKTNNKISVKYKSNDFALWVNGFKVATDTSGLTSIGLDRLNFDDGGGSADFYGKAKQIQYFDSALNDSDLETITSWTSFTDLANGQTYSIK